MLEFAAYSTAAMTLGLVVARPRLGESFRVTPALAAFTGIAFLFLLGVVRPAHVVHAATDLTSPFVTIASIMVMTEVAASVGLLKCWATQVEARASSTRRLFLLVFCLGVLTSTVLNNDASILVLTPVVLEMVKRRYPGRPELLMPFAFAVFMSAGVAALPVSNPMNMVVAELSGIPFNEYARRMLPVAAAGWVVAFAVLYLLFTKSLRAPVSRSAKPLTRATPPARIMAWLLLGVLVSYPIAGLLGASVSGVALAGALLSLGVAKLALDARPTELLRRGVSWETLAFLFCVLVLSLGLRDVGLVDRLARLYSDATPATVAVTSALGSAVLNNHPMSYLNLMALHSEMGGYDPRIFAALVGGDLGPRLLPMGSLAGLLWFEQLRRHGVNVGLLRFVTIGLALTAPTMVVSVLLLGV